jgi:hypothetical protein
MLAKWPARGASHPASSEQLPGGPLEDEADDRSHRVDGVTHIANRRLAVERRVSNDDLEDGEATMWKSRKTSVKPAQGLKPGS